MLDKTFYKDGGPLLVYTGNEAQVELFVNSTGFQSYTLAKRLNGLSAYCEHRYFGKSIPFNWTIEQANARGNNQWLSIDNAMQDYSLALKHLKNKYSSLGKVFTFGGSYGGLLAAWMRMRYPDQVDGAVISGAPVMFFDGIEGRGPDTQYYAFTAQLYAKQGS